MKDFSPVDYLAAIDQLRQEKQTEKHQIHDPDFIPARSEEPVDYLAASKAWEKAQAGKYKIHQEEP
ncbi:MAG: hypothetical protein K6F61_06085 [Clostridiales bacterium]|nr:hypothetical protein [Clostridiales bacterium]